MTASPAAGFNPLDATSVIAATGLIGIFCVLVAETGLLVGFFLPGDSLLFSAGLLRQPTARSTFRWVEYSRAP